jgi:hypothetical protein
VGLSQYGAIDMRVNMPLYIGLSAWFILTATSVLVRFVA